MASDIYLEDKFGKFYLHAYNYGTNPRPSHVKIYVNDTSITLEFDDFLRMVGLVSEIFYQEA